MLTRLLIALARLVAVFLALGLLAGWCMLGWGCIERRAHAAPKPFPKPPKPVAWPVGEWDASWGGRPGLMVFRENHSYLHRIGGQDWVGSWEKQGDAIAIVEQADHGGGVLGRPQRWWMPLGETDSLITGDWGRVRLQLRKPKGER